MGSGRLRPQRRDVPARALRADGAPRLHAPDDRRQQLTLRLLALTSVGAEALQRELPPALGNLLTIDIVDWPGTGQAVAVEQPTVATMVAFAQDLVDRDTVLFGQSMQGTLVLAVAAAVECRGVIAVTPATRLPPDVDAIRAFWESNAEPERKERADALRARFDAAPDSEKPMLYARYNTLRYFYDLDHEVPPPEEWTPGAEWAQQVMASGADVDWAATFDRVRSSVFVALGDHDFMAPPPLWLKAPPRSGWTTKMFERCGHSPFLERPDEFVAAVDTWLQQV